MYTVLAVDDEVDNLEMVEYALKDEFEVIPVKSGEMALKYLMGNTPDLILLDIRMPEMDGFEVYQKIKEQERLSVIPVIFLTSANDVETEDSCFALGAVDFISKPFEPKIVLRRVKRTLELIERSGHKSVASMQISQEDTEQFLDYNKKGKTLAITVNGMDIQLFQKDIYYIEVYGNTCMIRTTSREFAVRETLEHMQEKLGDNFEKIGRSYLVNVRYVAEILDDIVIMQNGKQIKMPRRNKKDIAKDILQKTQHTIE